MLISTDLSEDASMAHQDSQCAKFSDVASPSMAALNRFSLFRYPRWSADLIAQEASVFSYTFNARKSRTCSLGNVRLSFTLFLHLQVCRPGSRQCKRYEHEATLLILSLALRFCPDESTIRYHSIQQGQDVRSIALLGQPHHEYALQISCLQRV